MTAPDQPLASPRALHRLAEALGAGLMVVGGAVRDRLLGRAGGDWDLASALLPEEVLKKARAAGLKGIPTGLQHGTVTVVVEGIPFEITTFRGDGDYLDGRRPASVTLGVSLHEDLARRDFTINAMALPVEALDRPDWRASLVDPFGGQVDLAQGLVRAVGDPLVRFREDGLRAYRACRFAAQLGFRVEGATLAAMPATLDVSAQVAVERVWVELTKLLCGKEAGRGLVHLAESGLMDLCLPELRPLLGCTQNRYHAFAAWEHTLAVVEALPPDPGLRWAGLLHDLGKPDTRTVDDTGEAHFYQHEALSVSMAEAILRRLRASHALAGDVLALVRHHGNHPTDAWGQAACRRLLKRLQDDGLTLERWGQFRLADLVGKGKDVAERSREHGEIMGRLEALRATATALRVRDLVLDGKALMALAGRPGGPWLGRLQAWLLDQVLEEPSRNAPEMLTRLAAEWLERESV